MEELKDVKITKRHIYVIWVDLMNLYFQELVGVITKDRKGLGTSKQLTEKDKLKM